MNKNKRKKTILWCVAAIVVAACAATAVLHPGAVKQAYSRLTDSEPKQLFTPSASDLARGQYEFGKPVESLVNEAGVDTDSTQQGAQGGKGGGMSRQSVKQKVRAVRAKYRTLQDVYARYQQAPSAQLAAQGKKLKDEVNSGIDELMPIARQYDYQKGIDEANDMRRNMQKMNFD